MILLLYVDDLFVTSMDGLIPDTKMNLAAEFEMKDLGMMYYFLGMEVWQNVDGIFLRQGKYAVDILKRFGMMDLGARTLTVLRMGNSMELQEIVSGVMTQNSLRGVGVG